MSFSGLSLQDILWLYHWQTKVICQPRTLAGSAVPLSGIQFFCFFLFLFASVLEPHNLISLVCHCRGLISSNSCPLLICLDVACVLLTFARYILLVCCVSTCIYSVSQSNLSNRGTVFSGVSWTSTWDPQTSEKHHVVQSSLSPLSLFFFFFGTGCVPNHTLLLVY